MASELDNYLKVENLDDVFLVNQDAISFEEGFEVNAQKVKKQPAQYFACLRLRFFMTLFHLCTNKNKLWNATVAWLNVCVSSSGESDLFFRRYRLDREKEVFRILYEIDWEREKKRLSGDESGPDTRRPDTQNGMLRHFTDEDKTQILSHLLDNWFLARYDFQSSFKCLYELKGGLSDWFKSGFKNVLAFIKKPILWLAVFVITLMLVFLVFSVENWHLLGPWHWTDSSFYPEHDAAQISFRTLTFVLYVLSIVFITSLFRKMILPRLVAGIIVGYLFLLSAASFGTLAFTVNPFSFCLIFFSISAIAYILLFIETNKQLDVENEKVVSRTTSLFSLAMLESTVIGLFLGDLFDNIFLDMAPRSSQSPVSFIAPLGGIVYPKVILFFVPLAVLVGILLQLFWEDKPISRL